MSIFNKIEEVSYKIAKKIGKNDSKDDIEIYNYAAYSFLSGLLTDGVGLILSLIFGYMIPYIASHITFTVLRMGTGGYHCKTFMNCFFTTNFLFIIASVIGALTQDYSKIMFFISLVGAIFMFPICPKPSINSPSRGYSEDIRFRKIYRNGLLIVLSVSLISISFGLNLISTSISAGILIVCFIVSNVGERFVNYFWNLFKKK